MGGYKAYLITKDSQVILDAPTRGETLDKVFDYLYEYERKEKGNTDTPTE